MVDKCKYVVLDVETNGLNSGEHDLLSISLYKPDDNKIYNRFLPLDLNDEILTTDINGITSEMLEGANHLLQEDVEFLVEEFDLRNRVVLIYSDLDKRFIKKYFERHQLDGYGYFRFYNFKNDIFSSSYSSGNITKDNLCRILKIKNVSEKHSGVNDCILEWNLFDAMDNGNLIVINDDVFKFSSDYMIPASYICNYPNLKKYLTLPEIFYKYDIVMSVDVPWVLLDTPMNNGGGMILEHCINRSLNAIEIDNMDFLSNNKSKLEYWGTLPSDTEVINLSFNKDGTVSPSNSEHSNLVDNINIQLSKLKIAIDPIIDYLKTYVFTGKVYSQELVKHANENILALCDISDENNILEIKSYDYIYIDKIKYQLYYQSNGRNCYAVFYDGWRTQKLNLVKVVSCTEKEYKSFKGDLIKQKNEQERIRLQPSFKEKDLNIIEYNGKKQFSYFLCLKCKKQFRGKISDRYVMKHIQCPYCNPWRNIRSWDFNDNDFWDIEGLKYELRNKKIEIENYINKKEIYVVCKKCKQVSCSNYRNLKRNFICSCQNKGKNDERITDRGMPLVKKVKSVKKQNNDDIQRILENKNIQILKNATKNEKAVFKCGVCGYEWEGTYREAKHDSFGCFKCKILH